MRTKFSLKNRHQYRFLVTMKYNILKLNCDKCADNNITNEYVAGVNQMYELSLIFKWILRKYGVTQLKQQLNIWTIKQV